MQISGNGLLAGLGLVRQPQQAPQKKGPAQGPAQGTAEVRPNRSQAKATTGGPATGPATGLARARTLEQAVQALSDRGRLPPRGSLIDLRA